MADVAQPNAVDTNRIAFEPPPNPAETDENAIALRERFAKVSRRAARRAFWKRLPNRALPWAAGYAIGVWLAVGFVMLSPWPFETVIRHVVAAPNCGAARAVGLAPAHRGAPGYWPWLDRDARGVACGTLPENARHAAR